MSDEEETEGAAPPTLREVIRPIQVVDSEGNIVSASHADAARLLDSPMYSPANPDRMVQVIINSNERATMTAAEAVALRRQGIDQGQPELVEFATAGTAGAARVARIMEGENLAARDQFLDENFSGTALASSITDTATLGLFSAGLEAASPGSREALSNIYAANVPETITGQVLGTLASFALPGGAVATGGRAVAGANVARGVAAGGQAFGRLAGNTVRSALTRRLAARGASQATAARAGTVAGYATDALASAATFEMAASAIENRPLSASRILTDAGIVGVLGAGAGLLGRQMRAGQRLMQTVRGEVRAAEAAESTVRAAAAARIEARMSSAVSRTSRAANASVSRMRTAADRMAREFSNPATYAGRVNGTVDPLSQAQRMLSNIDATGISTRGVLGRVGESPARYSSDIFKRMMDFDSQLAGRANQTAVVQSARDNIQSFLANSDYFGDAANMYRASRRFRTGALEFEDAVGALSGKKGVGIPDEQLDAISSFAEGSEIRRIVEELGEEIPGGAAFIKASDDLLVAQAERLSARAKGAAEFEAQAAEFMRRGSPGEVAISEVAKQGMISGAIMDSPLSRAAFAGGAADLLGGSGAMHFAGASLLRPSRVLRSLGFMKNAMTKFETRLVRNNKRFEKMLSRAESVVSGVSRATPRVVSPIAAALRHKDPEKRLENYQKFVSEIRELAGNPQALQARLSESIMPLEELDSGIAQHAQMQLVGGLMAIVRAMPTISDSPLNPGVPTHLPSESEMDELIDTIEGVEDPLSTYDDFTERGHVSPAKARAVRETAPEVFGEIVTNMANSVVDHVSSGGVISYQLGIEISNLTGIPVDGTMNSEFIMSMSSNFAQTSAQSDVLGNNGFRPSARRIDQSSRLLTESQQVLSTEKGI